MNAKQRARIIIPAVVVVAVVVWLVTRVGGSEDGIRASGTVEATEADLGFQTAGRIESITVTRGNTVAAGDTLAALDQNELLARRAAAVAQVAAARAQLTELQTGFRNEEIAQGRAALRAAEQRLADARRDLERTQRLHAGGAVSQQAVDHQQTAVDLSQAQFDQAREQLAILETGPRPERIAAQRAMVQQAEASVAQIDAALSNTVVVAPFDGLITVRHREPGEIVGPGAPVLTLMNPSDRWVRIYVREDEIGLVTVGRQATITGDTYPDRQYTGEITYISSEAEFTPRNVQTTEERVKLVYEVRVRVTEDPSFDLKPGIAADVVLEVPPA